MVAVIGAGPVGLAVIATAGLYGAARIIAVDLDANRVEQARKFGATDGVDSGDADWKEQVMALTDGWGVDVAVEAVGVPQTFQMCTEIVRPAGAWPTSGCTATSANCSCRTSGFTTSPSPWAWSTPTPRRCCSSWWPGQADVDAFATHHFKLHDMMDAYDTFGRAAETKALKVIIDR